MGQSRLRARRRSAPTVGQGLFPGLWPLCAAHPAPPPGAVCSAGPGWGGETGNSGCSHGRWAAVYHLAPGTWRGNPPRPPIPWGKPGPPWGRGPRPCVCFCVMACACAWPFLGQILGARPSPLSSPPAPPQGGQDGCTGLLCRLGHWVGETLTAGGGCVGGTRGAALAQPAAHLVQMTSSCRLPWQRWHCVHRREKRSSRALRWDT